MTAALDSVLLALAADPADDTGWQALADCLEEAGQPARGELVRLQLWLRRRLDDPHWPAWEERLRALWSAGVEGCQPVVDSAPHGLTFVLVPPGELWMGARDEERWRSGDESPRHRVTLTRGFWLARTPVTRRQFLDVMGFAAGDGLRGRGKHPAVGVGHQHALDFCQRYGALAGRPCRLPTEAEWEYACRACTATSFCSGEGRAALELVGWCSYDGTWDGSGGTRPVMRGRPNSWGLYDMHGNVWEWCADSQAPYPDGPVTDPRGETEGQGMRVIRGGSWRGGPWFCRSAERWAAPPDGGDSNNGFRVAMELPS
jgi:uncharacterized protein (TIGR02996 family)